MATRLASLVAVAITAAAFASAAVSRADVASPWLTLAQAKREVRSRPTPLIYCEVARMGADACPVGWTPLYVDVRSARVRGVGVPELAGGHKIWRQFHVAASCAVDRIAGRGFNAVFLWSLRAGSRRVETASPVDPSLAGVAHLGCKPLAARE